MATEAELYKAREAGARFKSAVHKVVYLTADDQIAFDTPWGRLLARRTDIQEFRDVPPSLMLKIYATRAGIHIDALDIDISSAGLLADLFPHLRDELADSF